MARRAKGEGSLISTDRGWRASITSDGKKYYLYAKTKGEAATKLKNLRNQLAKGNAPVTSKYTVATWLDHWMKTTEPDRKPSTNAGYKQSMEKYLKPEIGHIKLVKLTLENVEEAYANLKEKGLSGSTLHQAHSILRVSLKQAVWRGHVSRNVAALVKPPTPDRKPVGSLSEADLLALHGALENHRFKARWHLSLGFGLRPGEAIALEWKHVDFKNNTIRVEQQILQVSGKGAILQESTKTESGTRVIPLPDYVMEMLKETRAQQLEDMAKCGDEWKTWEPDGKPHSWCFVRADGSPLRPGYDTTQWKKLLESAGLPHSKRYVTRHTAASMAISDGGDIPSVAEMMGHSNSNLTLSVYTHAIEERKRALADKAAQRFAKLSK